MFEKLRPLSRYSGQTIAIIVTLLGCFGLYYGCAMLMVPLSLRQPDFVRTITLLILLPISLSIICFALGGWIWSRTNNLILKKALKYVFGLSRGLISLIFIILTVGANFVIKRFGPHMNQAGIALAALQGGDAVRLEP
jgi:hypothetical protein